jgi:hypothetical protein
LQPCKCASGRCDPNFLPEDTTCIESEELGPCKVRKCKDDGVCAKKNADTGTPCFTEDSITCANAGSCDTGTCTLLGCTSPPPPCSTNADCQAEAPLCCKGNCVDDIGVACETGSGPGKCCAMGTDFPTLPTSSLQCISAEACPCGDLNYCPQGEIRLSTPPQHSSSFFLPFAHLGSPDTSDC